MVYKCPYTYSRSGKKGTSDFFIATAFDSPDPVTIQELVNFVGKVKKLDYVRCSKEEMIKIR